MTDPSVEDWRRIVAAQAQGRENAGSWTHVHADGSQWTHPSNVWCDELAPSVEPPSDIPTVDEVRAATVVAKQRHEDVVGMPSHYTQLPVEAIDITEHFNFCMGNALKYIWRADHKGKPVEDLRKAAWYIEREIERRERA